jgi:hypothetical protein
MKRKKKESLIKNMPCSRKIKGKYKCVFTNSSKRNEDFQKTCE